MSSHIPHFWPAMLGIALVASTACQDIGEPGPSVPRQASPSVAPAAEGARTLDDIFLEINAQAPGFGGMFLNSQGALVVMLTPAANPEAVRNAIVDVVGAYPGRPSLPMEVQAARYDVEQLQRWRLLFAGAGSHPAVILSDMNEVRNRIVLGVTNMSSAPEIRGILEGLGVPLDAVVIETREIAVATTTLRDSVGVVIGGLMFNSVVPGQWYGECSTGFNANRTGDATGLYMITASHCTKTMGYVDGDSLFAPGFITYWRHGIGHETTDPAFSSIAGCPGGKTCRLSDAAAFKYENAASGQLGLLARTLFATTTSGNTLVRDTADFHLTGAVKDSSVMLFGMWINKVGQRTGWSSGRIDETCVNRTHTGLPANTELVCQFSAWNALAVDDTLYTYPGDSGSPVFFVNGLDLYSEGLSWIAGIVHSTSVSITANANGFTPNGKKTFWFSPFSGVSSDLGISHVSSPECEPNAPYWNNCKP